MFTLPATTGGGPVVPERPSDGPRPGFHDVALLAVRAAGIDGCLVAFSQTVVAGNFGDP